MQLYEGVQVLTTVSLRDAIRWVRSPGGQEWLRALPVRAQMPTHTRAVLVCTRCDKMLIKGKCLCTSPSGPARRYVPVTQQVCPDQLCARRSGHRGLHSWEVRVLNSQNPMGEFK